MKILLAIDGSPCSDEAIDEIGRRPWPVGSEIKVLSAIELPLPPTPEAWAIPPNYLEELDRAASEHARAIVERGVQRLKKGMSAEDGHQGRGLAGSTTSRDPGRSGELGCGLDRGWLTWLPRLGTLSAGVDLAVDSFTCEVLGRGSALPEAFG